MASSTNLEARLAEFREAHKIRGKGPLAVVVYLSHYALKNGLPISPDSLVANSEGQVRGLGKEAVQRVLTDYGVTQVLAEEGGRTSRGSLNKMRLYITFLNELHAAGVADMQAVEAWWIERVREHFAAKPFRLRYDTAKSLQSIIQDVLAQAKKRQQEGGGTMYQGAMLQHLVGAKLELALPAVLIEHNGFSVADAVSDRSGDFMIDETIIHVTVSPGEAIIRKCCRNLDAGARPIILTVSDNIPLAKGLAANAGVAGRIDIMDVEQFVAVNLHELSLFKVSARRTALESLVETYNRIVSEHETDPSLQIEIG